MIGRLIGTVAGKSPPRVLIDVSGVGYEVVVPMSSFYNLPALGEQVTLLTHCVVREDAQPLFGFATDDERAAFRELIRIAGIGPRTALAILSGLSVSELTQAVAQQQAARLVKVPGIGKKTAERLLLELKGKLGPELGIGANATDASAGRVATGYQYAAHGHKKHDAHSQDDPARSEQTALQFTGGGVVAGGCQPGQQQRYRHQGTGPHPARTRGPAARAEANRQRAAAWPECAMQEQRECQRAGQKSQPTDPVGQIRASAGARHGAQQGRRYDRQQQQAQRASQPRGTLRAPAEVGDEYPVRTAHVDENAEHEPDQRNAQQAT